MKKLVFIICFLCITVVGVFAYNFQDAIVDIHPEMEGTESAIEIINLINKVFSQIGSDEKSIEFLDYLDESLKKFDFKLLYNYPDLKPLKKGFRGVTIQGINEKNRYYLGLSPEQKDNIENNTIGSFATEIGLKQIDKSIVGYRSFSAYMDTEMALKQYSHENLLLFADSLLKIIDPDNLKNISSPESDIFNTINGDSRIVLNAFYEAFPRLSKILDQYLSLSSLMEIKNYNDISYTHFKITSSCKYKQLQKDYPLIAKYLNQFRNVLKTSIVSQNMNGNQILKLQFDCSEDFFSFSIYTKSGRIIPSDKNGDPVFKDSFSLAMLKSYQFDLITRLLFDAYGLKYLNESILSKGTYINTDRMAALNIKLENVSKTKVYGRKYHIIPKWLIDFMIPDDIDRLIYELVTVMLHANDDDGSFVRFEFDKRNSREILMNSMASSEYVDNFFIKLELGIWRNILKTNKETIDQINSLIIKTLNAIWVDLASQNKIS
ncbi:conserved hypothetical protein, secreted [Candidatus Magnetomorum sp. HK-1]|nr:conserved hypothetical protein, secreted [Candidatus Magnetomorum sp. HK-1]